VELEEKYVNSIVAFYSNFNSDFLAHERKLGEKNLEARYAKQILLKSDNISICNIES